MMKQKDIYMLGILILEIMTGKPHESRFSLTIESLPVSWARKLECTPLIQVSIN